MQLPGHLPNGKLLILNLSFLQAGKFNNQSSRGSHVVTVGEQPCCPDSLTYGLLQGK